MLGKVVERAPEVLKQKLGEVATEAVANQDALHHEIAAVRRHGVRRYLPAASAQTVGKIIEREAGTRTCEKINNNA